MRSSRPWKRMSSRSMKKPWNALPQLAASTINCRVLPDDSIDYVQSTLQQVVADELKRVHAPVFTFGLHHIGVGEQEDGFARAGAAIANYQVGLLGIGSTDKDVGAGKSRGSQASCRGFGNRSSGACGVTRLDFDKFLVDVAGEVFSASGRVVWD